MTMKNGDMPAMPKCMHFRCLSTTEVAWDRSCYDTTSLADGELRYRGECPSCGTNYLHSAEALDSIIEGLEK